MTLERRVTDDSDRLQLLINEARELNSRLGQSAYGNGGQATITVNAGGVGVWIAVTCAIVCTMTTIAVFALFVNLDRKVDRATDYQQANYRSSK